MNKSQFTAIANATSESRQVKTFLRGEKTAKVTAFKKAVEAGRIMREFHYILKDKDLSLLTDLISKKNPNLSEAEVKESANFLRRTYKAEPWKLYGFEGKSNYFKYLKIGHPKADDKFVDDFINKKLGLRKEDFGNYVEENFPSPRGKGGGKGKGKGKGKSGGSAPQTPETPTPTPSQGANSVGFFVKELGLNVKVDNDHNIWNEVEGKKSSLSKDEILTGLEALKIVINEAIASIENKEAKKSA